MNLFVSSWANGARATVLGMFFVLSGSGCATAQSVNPKDVAVTIQVMNDGTAKVFAPNGQEVKSCKLCTEEVCGKIDPKDKEAIKKLTAAGYCAGLVNATTIAPHLDLSVMRTHVNPWCWTTTINGVPHLYCICAPGESDPRCLNQ
jgi:hypothetical protein